MNGDLCGKLISEALDGVRDRLAKAGLGDFVVKQAGRATYDSSSFSLKIEIREEVVHESGVAMTKEAEDFLQHAFYLNMAKSDLGRVVSTDRGDVQVIGFRRRARKFPMLVKYVRSGKVVCMKEDYIRTLLERDHGTLEERGGTPVTLTEVTGLLGGA